MPLNTAPTFIVRDGKVITDFGGQSSLATSVILQKDGKIVVAGLLRDGSNSKFVMARYNTDGSLDTSFGSGGKIISSLLYFAYDLSIQADGKFVVIGPSAIAKYDTSGQLDTTFGIGGIVSAVPLFGNIITQSDGKFLVTGGSVNFGVNRYNIDGSLDVGFGSNGFVKTDFGSSQDMSSALVLQRDGKILVAGITVTKDGYNFALARYNFDGSLDKSFDTDGKSTADIDGNYRISVQSGGISVQSDGKILVAGTHVSNVGMENSALLRFNADGSLDLTFNKTGKVSTSFAFNSSSAGGSVVQQSDGKILVAGSVNSLATKNAIAVARYNVDGSLDLSFDFDGIVVTGIGDVAGAYRVILQEDGKILVAGVGGNSLALVRYNADGSLDTSFSDPENTITKNIPYTENQAPILLAKDAQVFDAELSKLNNYDGAVLTLSRDGEASSQDVFSAAGGTLTVLKPNSFFAVEGITIGRVTTNSGGTLTLLFNENATQSLVNKAMQNIAYANTSDAPPATVQINWNFNDGNIGAQGTGGAMSVTNRTTVSIMSVNDNPLLVTPISSQSLAAGSSFNFAIPKGTFVDPDADTLTYNVTLSDGTGVPPWLKFNANTQTFSGTPAVVDVGTISVKVTAKDVANTIATGNFNVTVIPPDTTPPTANIFSPLDEATDVAIDSNIVVTFSEPIQRGTGNILLKTANGNLVESYTAASQNLNVSGSTLTIDPTANLSQGTSYKVEFEAGAIKDLAGNSYTGTTTYNFTTVFNKAPTLTISSIPESTYEAEFNDDHAHATRFTSAAVGSLSGANDVDWFAVTLNAPGMQTVTFDTSSMNFGIWNVYWYDPNMQVMSGRNIGASIGSSTLTYDFVAYASGTYYVRVQASQPFYNGGQYNIFFPTPNEYVDTSDDDVFLNKTGKLIGRDADAGSTLTYGISGGIDDGNTVSKLGSFGILTVTKASGAYSFAPNSAAIQGLKSSVSEVFSFTVSDGTAITEANYTINLIGANDPTVFSGTIIGTVSEDGTLSANGTLSIGDRDTNDSANTVIIPQTNVVGTYGKFSIGTSGNWTYTLTSSSSKVQTLKEGESGKDAFTVTTAGGVTQNIIVTVNGANDAPIFATDSVSATTTEDTALKGSVTANDADGDSLEYRLSSSAKHGTVSVNLDGSYSYLPAANYFGNDSFTVKVTDRMGGKVISDITPNEDKAFGVAIQSNGKIIVAGVSGNGSNDDFSLVRYNSDGTLDTTFSNDGMLTTDFGASIDGGNSVIVQSDGKIVVAGSSANNFALVRYNIDGSLDTSFSGDGKVTTAIDNGSYGKSATLQADGKILVAGFSFSPYAHFALARYNTDGSLDTAFSGDGIVTTAIGSPQDRAWSVTTQADGKILVAGYSRVGNFDSFSLVRYNANGSLDNSFDADGMVTTSFGVSVDHAYSVVMQPDGKILVAGAANSYFGLIRYNANGSLDMTFSGDGKVITPIGSIEDAGQSVAVQPDGKILVAGYTNNGANVDFALVRYNVDGSLDSSFGMAGIVTTDINSKNDYGRSVKVQEDGKILVAGTSDNNFAVVRYNTDGTLDSNFSMAGSSPSNDILQTVNVNISAVNDLPTGNVSIAGTAKQGQTLTASNSLSDSDGLGTVTYQWQSNGVSITNAIASNYTLTEADVGKAITVVASYIDGGGVSEKKASVATAAVASLNNLPTGSVTLSGLMLEGQTISTLNSISDLDGISNSAISTYKWTANGEAIAGANSSELLLTNSLAGKSVNVTIGYTDNLGNLESMSSNNSVLVGGKYVGSSGKDTLIGSAGNDLINGKEGEDTVSYSGSATQHTIVRNGANVSVIDKLGIAGNDTLTNIEAIAFSDRTINLQIQAKAANAPIADVTRLIELYIAFFNRVPDADGLSYWIEQKTNGLSINQIAETFYSAGIKYSHLSGFSETMSNADFVNVVYRNVLGRVNGADADGLSYWSAQLVTGRESRGSLVSTILDSAHSFKGEPNYGWVADLLDNKIAVAKIYAIDLGINFNNSEDSIRNGMAVAAAVTPTDVSAALTLIGISPQDMILN